MKEKKTRGAAHASQCTVCKHPLAAEIEAAYSSFAPLERVAREFGVSRSAVIRHAAYFGLDAKRAADPQKILEQIIASGFSNLKKVNGPLLMAAIRELNRITGKYKRPETNPADVERERDNRAWAEGELQKIMAERGIGRAEALDLAREHAPTLAKWLM